MIHEHARWLQNGACVAGGHGAGNQLNQLFFPEGLAIDGDANLYIADWWNNRIIEREKAKNNIRIVLDQSQNRDEFESIFQPTSVIIDREFGSLVIAENGRRRVLQLSCQDSTIKVETLIEKTRCWGLAIDEQGNVYVTDIEEHEVRRYVRGKTMTKGEIVAGGNGPGSRDDQLNSPRFVYVDSEMSVYVSDQENHRIMKWVKGATVGIRVAGGYDAGQDLAHLWYPSGIVVDKAGVIYVADTQNHRVLRWRQNKHEGELIAGGRGRGAGENQLDEPKGLCFDDFGNMYVTDKNNHRILCFEIR